MAPQDEQGNDTTGSDPTVVSAEERQAFLERQGWKRASEDERREMEQHWTDADIRMAIDMNLA